jgi:hypothetical protein
MNANNERRICVIRQYGRRTRPSWGADGYRYTKPSSTFRSSFVPADGTSGASYESGDFDTSPFLGSPRASCRPRMHLWYREQSTMVQREFIAQLTSLSLCWLHR